MTTAQLIDIELEIRRRARAKDFGAFLQSVTPQYTWDWPYLQYIRKHLQDITDGKLTRLIISVPPQHGKSAMTTVRYPVYRLLREPTLRVMIAAYNHEFATEFTTEAREIASRIMPLSADNTKKHFWQTAQGGGIRALGVGTGATGRPVKLLIIDDPVKNREEAESAAYRKKVWNWYTSSLRVRVHEGGAIILIMTRWHDDDLAGRLIKESKNGGDEWTVVNLPALAEENDPLGRQPHEALSGLFSAATLQQTRRAIGEYDFAALFQQQPRPREGRFFGQPTYYGELPPDSRIVGGLDLAYTAATRADESAVVIARVHDEKIYLIHCETWQKEFSDTLNIIKRLRDKYKCIFACEANGAQKATFDMIRGAGIQVLPIIRKFDKYAEAQAAGSAYNTGKVLLPDPEKFPATAAWVQDWLDEAEAFTGLAGGRDNRVDAFVNMYKKAFYNPTVI